jgi:hypothetical protein
VLEVQWFREVVRRAGGHHGIDGRPRRVSADDDDRYSGQRRCCQQLEDPSRARDIGQVEVREDDVERSGRDELSRFDAVARDRHLDVRHAAQEPLDERGVGFDVLDVQHAAVGHCACGCGGHRRTLAGRKPLGVRRGWTAAETGSLIIDVHVSLP